MVPFTVALTCLGRMTLQSVKRGRPRISSTETRMEIVGSGMKSGGRRARVPMIGLG